MATLVFNQYRYYNGGWSSWANFPTSNKTNYFGATNSYRLVWKVTLTPSVGKRVTSITLNMPYFGYLYTAETDAKKNVQLYAYDYDGTSATTIKTDNIGLGQFGTRWTYTSGSTFTPAQRKYYADVSVTVNFTEPIAEAKTLYLWFYVPSTYGRNYSYYNKKPTMTSATEEDIPSSDKYVKINVGGQFANAIPYIWTTEWKKTEPYVYHSSEWRGT